MGLVRMGPPEDLIKQLQAKFEVKNFVETGTFQADTARWAASLFESVFTIEFSKPLYEKALEAYNYVENIHFIFGNSKDQITAIKSQIQGASVFWLDAHWSGGLTFGEGDECPLLEEIDAINHHYPNSFILIDDARCFTSPPQAPHDPEQWPDITAIVNTLTSTEKGRYTVIIEDVIISVPEFAKSVVVEYCQKVNEKSWNDYANRLNTSDFTQGLNLISSSLKRKLSFSSVSQSH